MKITKPLWNLNLCVCIWRVCASVCRWTEASLRASDGTTVLPVSSVSKTHSPASGGNSAHKRCFIKLIWTVFSPVFGVLLLRITFLCVCPCWMLIRSGPVHIKHLYFSVLLKCLYNRVLCAGTEVSRWRAVLCRTPREVVPVPDVFRLYLRRCVLRFYLRLLRHASLLQRLCESFSLGPFFPFVIFLCSIFLCLILLESV